MSKLIKLYKDNGNKLRRYDIVGEVFDGNQHLFFDLEDGGEEKATITVDNFTEVQEGPVYKVDESRLTPGAIVTIKVEGVNYVVVVKVDEKLAYKVNEVTEVPYVQWPAGDGSCDRVDIYVTESENHN